MQSERLRPALTGAVPPAPANAIHPYAWVILLVVFLASVAAPLNMAKVPPLMPLLLDSLQIELSQGGLLMSVFAITGLILALPSAFVVQRFGLKITGLLAVGSLTVGAALGAVAPDFGLLLVSRVIEGVGMGLITIIGPAIIAIWFPQEKRGTPMGIWATWVPVGNVLMYMLAPSVAASLGWQAVWWGGAAFALLALVLFAWLMRLPPEDTPQPLGAGLPAIEPTKLRQVFSNRSIWLLALCFGFFNLVFMGFGTYFPTFLVDVRGYALADAAVIASLGTFVALGAAPFAGWLSDRIGSRKRLIVLPALLLAVIFLFPFTLTGLALYGLLIVMGLVGPAIPTATFAAVPEVMGRPQLAGLGMVVLSIGQNAGMVLGPLLFGPLVETLGWATAGYLLIPGVLVTGFVALFIKLR